MFQLPPPDRDDYKTLAVLFALPVGVMALAFVLMTLFP